MTETQARQLAAEIEAQFPHTETVVVQATDMRNVPRNWFIGVYRKQAPEPRVGLHIHSRFEWIEACTALYVLES